MRRKTKKHYQWLLIILLSILFIAPLVQAQSHIILPEKTFNHHELISQGFTFLNSLIHDQKNIKQLPINNYIRLLEQWYNDNPGILFASYIEPTMTLCFMDETYILLFDVPSMITNQPTKQLPESNNPISSIQQTDTTQTAAILNPSEYLYGNRHCQKIITTLLRQNYNIIYQANQHVDLRYIRDNLTGDIIYLNTHAGYWDVDGDQKPDIVVMGTGEHWTNETPSLYAFEYEQKMIVEGIVGDTSFVCFTPSFITYHYEPDDLPSSLIYMATCHASYDESMANAFLSIGADVYIGWTKNTVSFINSKTSVQAFRLFGLNLTAQQICRLIRSGGIFNMLLQSRLVFFGNKDYRIP